MQEKNQSKIEYFQNNFEQIAYFPLIDKKIFLGNKDNRRCRFCGKKAPEVSFRKIAHAIPELIGNKLLFSYYECDSCNENFSKTLEDHFAKFLGPGRTISFVKGKSGVPSYKNGTFRIDVDNKINMVSIKDSVENTTLAEDTESKKISFKAIKEPYIPIAVYKCLVKMALSIMPEEELSDFDWAINWVSEEDHNSSRFAIKPLILYHVYTPGPQPYPYISNFLFRRKSNPIEKVPYLIYVVAFANFLFQIFLPKFQKGTSIKEEYKVDWFPIPYDEDYKYGLSQYTSIDLSSTTIVKGEEITLSWAYEEAEDL